MKAQTPVSRPPCRHCTVPVDDGGDICAFCLAYVPPEIPAQQLDVLVNRLDILRADGNEILRELPVDAPLFAVSDLVAALGHLRRASVLIDRAADQLEAAEAIR